MGALHPVGSAQSFAKRSNVCSGGRLQSHASLKVEDVIQFRVLRHFATAMADHTNFPYFFVALPSMKVIHVVPSIEISNLMLWLVGERILIVIFCLISWPP